jgi:hypothetical protein
MGAPQQWTLPLLGLMHSTSVPHFSHWNRLPSWLAMLYLPLLLQFHRLTTAGEASLATFGNDHLRAALSTLITLAHLIGHLPSASVTRIQGNASK